MSYLPAVVSKENGYPAIGIVPCPIHPTHPMTPIIDSVTRQTPPKYIPHVILSSSCIPLFLEVHGWCDECNCVHCITVTLH